MIRIAITQAAFDAIAATTGWVGGLRSPQATRVVYATFGWKRGGSTGSRAIAGRARAIRTSSCGWRRRAAALTEFVAEPQSGELAIGGTQF